MYSKFLFLKIQLEFTKTAEIYFPAWGKLINFHFWTCGYRKIIDIISIALS